MRAIGNLLITGGCGFIGTNFIKSLLASEPSVNRIVNLDKMTEAVFSDTHKLMTDKNRYVFMRGDVCNYKLLLKIIKKYHINTICHFAAESHVDNSISHPGKFLKTNVTGTFSVLEAIRISARPIHLHYASTDEIFGSVTLSQAFTERSVFNPRSPYSATKAAGNHLVNAYHYTYGLSVTISNSSNNYGPYQNPEKFIPRMLWHILNLENLPLYGNGQNIRDWIHVDDNNSAIITIIKKGKNGESYNVGARNEWQNKRLAERLCDIVSEETNKNPDILKMLISYVDDRPGHDRHYALDPSKIEKELGWYPQISFDTGLRETVRWYIRRFGRLGRRRK
jgi:dTDP-glucose 4,6-dehydratase